MSGGALEDDEEPARPAEAAITVTGLTVGLRWSGLVRWECAAGRERKGCGSLGTPDFPPETAVKQTCNRQSGSV